MVWIAVTWTNETTYMEFNILGARAAQRAAHLFAVKYKHNKKVNEVLACYQEGVRFSLELNPNITANY